MNNSPQRAAKGFTRAFWVSNTVELFERMAYYAVFIVLTIYLSSILGFNDFEASMISGLFSGGLYLLPIFSGAYADKIGFRKSMIIAFSLLSIGYLGLGVLPTLLEAAGLVSYGVTTQFNGLPDSYTRWIIVPVLFVLMVGGSFIKSIISASVAKETTEATRARGYSIFYMMVNVGAFTGKTIIDPLRNVIGEQAYIYINYFSGAMTIIALLAVILPNRYGSYNYYDKNDLFPILRDNIDNGYTYVVKWDEFKKYPLTSIDKAYEHQENTSEYKIVKSL